MNRKGRVKYISMGRRENVLKAFEEQKSWMERRIADGIEQNRKGDFYIQFTDEQNKSVGGVLIEAEQIDHDFNFGANLYMLDEFDTQEKNEKYRFLYRNLFNAATLPFYWSDIEPEQGKLRFDKNSPRIYRRPTPDLCLEYCEQYNIRPKGHCLNYDAWTPLWVPREVKDVKRLLDKRMSEIAERYKDRIYGWEVTNELLMGMSYRPLDNAASTPFFKEDDVLEWSFETARRHFPLNELIINDAVGMWVEYNYNRSPYYMQIERALQKGAPIDAIGFQFHVFEDEDVEKINVSHRYNPKRHFDVLDLYSKFNLPMQITEITIPAYSSDSEGEEIQAEIAKNLYSIWFSAKNMESIIYWNTVDGYACKSKTNPDWDENTFFGGLVRKDFTPKPIYNTLYELIHKTWHTSARFEANERGKAYFRGFFGTYRLKITADGKTVEKNVHFGTGTETPVRIVL